MKKKKFGRYEIVSKIATGGMAEVYRARSTRDKFVAIKLIHSSFTANKKFITMFVDEAKIMVSLKHPNIVQIFEFGLVDDEYFLTMEWIDGRPLSSLIRRQLNLGVAFPIELAIFIILEICCGLEYAHQKKDSFNQPLSLIHRDLSPPNILISRGGDVKIADFGIAQARGKVSLTQPGILKGKFSYMSPEQARGEELDQRSDIFSTGIMLHELLTGQRLFLADKDTETIENVRRAKVTAPSKLNPEVCEALDHICLKALSKRKSKRYQSATEFAADLEYLLVNNYRGTDSAKLKSFIQFLYPNVKIYEEESVKNEIISSWQQRVQQNKLLIAKDIGKFIPCDSLPSLSQDGYPPRLKAGVKYYLALFTLFILSCSLIIFDYAKREPNVMHSLKSSVSSAAKLFGFGSKHDKGENNNGL